MTEPIFTPCTRDAFLAAVERHKGRMFMLGGVEYGEIPTDDAGLLRLIGYYKRRDGEWGVDEPKLFDPAPYRTTDEERAWAHGGSAEQAA